MSSIDPDAAGEPDDAGVARQRPSAHGSSDKFLSEKALDSTSRSNRKSDSCADETEHLREL
jgi:hypothetical protein